MENNTEILRYKNTLRKLTAKHTHKGKDGVKIETPEDILLLNCFPCFRVLPYTHDSRLVLASICLWCGLSTEDTLLALRVFAEDKGYYDPNRHLHSLRQIKSLKKYNFTCNSMKNRGLCPLEDKYCESWFYRKINLPSEFYKSIEKHKIS